MLIGNGCRFNPAIYFSDCSVLHDCFVWPVATASEPILVVTTVPEAEKEV